MTMLSDSALRDDSAKRCWMHKKGISRPGKPSSVSAIRRYVKLRSS